MSPKIYVGFEKCGKLHRVIFSFICLKISGNCSGVFQFLSAWDLKQNCKSTVSKVMRTFWDLEGEGAGALLIYHMKREGGVFHGGPGIYLEDLKLIESYTLVILKGMWSFLWRVRFLFGKPETKFVMPTCNIEEEERVFHDRYFKDIKLILPFWPEICNGKGRFSIVSQVFIW